MAQSASRTADILFSPCASSRTVFPSPPIHFNLDTAELMALALERNEGVEGFGQTLVVTTGRHTGRSPEDKFFVRSALTENHIDTSANRFIESKNFDYLKHDMLTHINKNPVFVQDLEAGADSTHKLNIRVMTELAWHSLFIRHLLRVPKTYKDYVADYIIINAPSFKADPSRHGCRSETVIAIDLNDKTILIAGTEYAGETKKAVFTVLNYLLPAKNVMPMHCSANHAIDDPDDVAIFFGLSGTGKTTLSADPSRVLIGDDEHGWSDDGVFNFEGGCYAKTINLTAEAEPEIYAATRMTGSIIENTVIDPRTKAPDFTDDSITANMRCAYPLSYIENASDTSCGSHPNHIIMLTCDAFGVMPPIARLMADQAVYHFLNGFTSKVAGTECGVKEPQPTFSTCFGAPFMPLKPNVYGDLLRSKIEKHGSQCWLINTGWTGGGYATGERIPIKETRALLHAILNNHLENVSYRTDENFEFQVPTDMQGVSSSLLNPRMTWSDPSKYDQQAKQLVAMFEENFRKYK